ncbi:hypothetical protein [Campylobacter geochelonis]|uniref:hypothetical protein n=1 Tax=Campylobacter geochelonis TaxID=1780362 RepID=UPI000770AC94|nr:hypothetical protein [Campylobacter geochelonis]CZE48929.1 Uncharacterised protein [Campylobacter geochelonis]CZE49908.1 Uncharacterised protein [Campylobacter geochelonis]
MSKSIIKNTLGSRTFTFAVPAAGAEALAFANAHLDGSYVVYEVVSKVGNETVANCNKVALTLKNSTTGDKYTFSFYAKSTLGEDEIRAGLIGITVNGVKADEIYIIGMESVAIAGA